MRQYLDLMERVLSEGAEKRDRTGTGTRSIFGHQMRFDLQSGFPLVTTKKLHVKSIIYELLWFLRGDTNVKYLNDHGVHDLGRMGRRERRPRPGLWPAMAVVADAGRRLDRSDPRWSLDTIRRDPDSRRIIVTAWNPARLSKMALSPCHCLFQFYVAEGAAVVPALSALRRRVSRRAVQHRLLRAC